jgi:small GTP-binding protein
LTSSYYRGANGVIVVFDLTDEQSFSNLRNWFGEVERHCSENIPRLLIGNKSDLVNKRVIDQKTAQEFANNLGIPYIETSAKETNNVDEAFLKIVEEISNKKDVITGPKGDTDKILIQPQRQGQSNSGCNC